PDVGRGRLHGDVLRGCVLHGLEAHGAHAGWISLLIAGPGRPGACCSCGVRWCVATVAVKRLAGGWCAGSVAPPVVLAAATAKPRRSFASRWNSVVFAGGSCSHRAPPPVVSCSHEDPGNPQCLGLTFPTDPKMLWPTG